MQLLPKTRYHEVMAPLKQVPFNTLFARSVIENKEDVGGQIYVNDITHPTAYFIVHPYGMTIIFGDPNDVKFNKALASYLRGEAGREQGEVMLVYPEETWSGVTESILTGESLTDDFDAYKKSESVKALRTRRINFDFDKEQYEKFKGKLPSSDKSYDIKQIDEKIYNQLKEDKDLKDKEEKPLPHQFWSDAEKFLKNSVGFSLYDTDKDGNKVIAAVVFAAFQLDNSLEIAIFTREEFRKRGHALKLCVAIIDYSLQHKLQPVWSCLEINERSLKLAEKIGFKQAKFPRIYKLKEPAPAKQLLKTSDVIPTLAAQLAKTITPQTHKKPEENDNAGGLGPTKNGLSLALR